MRVEKDFEELLRLFNKHGVKYCIVGAFAMAFHALPRYTKDLDVLVEPAAENAQKIIEALKEFGFGSLNLSKGDFSREGKCVQLGYDPVRVGLTTSLQGLDFSEIWGHREKGKYGHQVIFFIGLDELIKNKKVAHRKQDVVDLEKLSTLKKKTRKK